MKRAGWVILLAQWAEQRYRQPFAWGRTDCAMLALEAFDLMTGGALVEKHRGRYSTSAQALRYQRRETDLPAELQRAGCFRVRDGEAVVALHGDILIAERDGFLCGHVCLGKFALSASIEQGAVALCHVADLLARPDAFVLRVP